MDARLGVAALPPGAGTLAGCASASSDTARDDAGAAVAAGDPSYTLAALRHDPGGDDGVLPTSLAEALPNHHLELGDTGRVSSFSDAVVVGHVAAVTRGHGVVWRDDDDSTVVAYDDPAARTGDDDGRAHSLTTRQQPGSRRRPDPRCTMSA